MIIWKCAISWKMAEPAPGPVGPVHSPMGGKGFSIHAFRKIKRNFPWNPVPGVQFQKLDPWNWTPETGPLELDPWNWTPGSRGPVSGVQFQGSSSRGPVPGVQFQGSSFRNWTPETGPLKLDPWNWTPGTGVGKPCIFENVKISRIPEIQWWLYFLPGYSAQKPEIMEFHRRVLRNVQPLA